MQIYLDNVIDEYRLNTITDTLSNEQLFEDGGETAGRTAQQAKNNLQANADAIEVKGAAKMVEKALLANPLFCAAVMPKKFAKIMFSVYRPGMKYGSHIDEAFINNTRTDLSFTLFLSDLGEYQGGELVLESHSSEEPIKLNKGSLFVYPSNSLHRVEEIKSGKRLAAVGWIESRIRAAEQREILFDLYNAFNQLPDHPDNQQARLNILKTRQNLMRLWAE